MPSRGQAWSSSRAVVRSAFRFAAAEGGGTTITLFYRAGGYTPDDLSQFAPVVDQVQAQHLGALGQFLNAAP